MSAQEVLMLLSLILGPVVTAEIVVALTGVSLLTKDGSRKSYSLFCLSIKMRHSTFFFLNVALKTSVWRVTVHGVAKELDTT